MSSCSSELLAQHLEAHISSSVTCASLSVVPRARSESGAAIYRVFAPAKGLDGGSQCSCARLGRLRLPHHYA
jgi:hypothetical protein